VAVTVAVALGVALAVWVGDDVGVAVGGGVAVAVDVAVELGVGVAVGVSVAVAVGVWVGVAVNVMHCPVGPSQLALKTGLDPPRHAPPTGGPHAGASNWQQSCAPGVWLGVAVDVGLALGVLVRVGMSVGVSVAVGVGVTQAPSAHTVSGTSVHPGSHSPGVGGRPHVKNGGGHWQHSICAGAGDRPISASSAPAARAGAARSARRHAWRAVQRHRG
jgi:hypothetical protein